MKHAKLVYTKVNIKTSKKKTVSARITRTYIPVFIKNNQKY